MGRKPKVCEVCLGDAETTQHKCSGIFGSSGCNDWLWGWFVVDDTVHRAAKSYKEAQNSASDNTARDAIALIKYFLANMTAYGSSHTDGREAIYKIEFTESTKIKMEKVAQQHP